MKETILHFNRDGTVRAVVSDEALQISEAIGATVTLRASNVVPANVFKFVAFILLRQCFGERGRVANWTRTWRGDWEVWMKGNTQRRPDFAHPSRRVCIDWEVRELNRRFGSM